MTPEILRRFYRIRRSKDDSDLVVFVFRPRDGRYPRRVYRLEYWVRSRRFNATCSTHLSKVNRREGRLVFADHVVVSVETSPLVAALSSEEIASLVTKSINAQNEPPPLVKLQYVRLPTFGAPYYPPPAILPPIEVKFEVRVDNDAWEKMAEMVAAEIAQQGATPCQPQSCDKETTDAAEVGHRKQAAGREDRTHVRATVLRGDDRSKGDR
ncbi:hypothetical protein [Shinella sp. JR1-6]|uniref:hypothetical protein n=1 Tax=Shinella sp. JR1-6 TaxID=2527671 RepID=UPI00102D3C7F|nr:hypothetical protein [Shinella sp. JR1-6]TAA54595.1 hypothetical protein EXZ48_26585 [Shinella sp. JR1-6]